ncbi:MAG TPA: CAP domain-containing protein, partial [Polyangiaceae bacterium]|nr:CAP domain-containing protein [Polyangiaceae bacterium]
MLRRIVSLLSLGVALGCAPPSSQAQATRAVPRPAGPAPGDQASRYMLTLINRDRAAAGLEPVELDPVATVGAERHARDMAKHGFTAHWGTDGSVPEQRYTEAGGTDMVQENVAG